MIFLANRLTFLEFLSHSRYTGDNPERHNWDVLQSRMRCCGARSYNEFRTTVPRCVPPTCCHDYDPNDEGPQCTTALSPEKCINTKVHEYIYQRGCMEIVDDVYRKDLQGLMLVYGIGGTIFALVELVAVFLSSAYAAQISRRAKREREAHSTWAPGEDVTSGGVHHHPGGVHHHPGGGLPPHEELPMDDRE